MNTVTKLQAESHLRVHRQNGLHRLAVDLLRDEIQSLRVQLAGAIEASVKAKQAANMWRDEAIRQQEKLLHTNERNGSFLSEMTASIEATLAKLRNR